MRIVNNEIGSIELVVLGLLAALIVVLAVPLIGDIGTGAVPSATQSGTQAAGSAALSNGDVVQAAVPNHS